MSSKMTVAELVDQLKKYPGDTQISIFYPFDAEGPESWGTPEITITEDGLRLHPGNVIV